MGDKFCKLVFHFLKTFTKVKKIFEKIRKNIIKSKNDHLSGHDRKQIGNWPETKT